MPIPCFPLDVERFGSREAAFAYLETPAGRREHNEFIREHLAKSKLKDAKSSPSPPSHPSHPSHPRPTRPPSPPSPKVEPNSREAFGKIYPIPETPQDAFRVLNLNPNANQSDIKTAYTRISRSVHPDKNTPDEQTRLKCTARQQQATAAYLLLKPNTGGKKRRTMKKSNSKRLNKHFKKSRRHTQT